MTTGAASAAFSPKGAPVTAICRTPQSIDLFITGNDGTVYTSWWSDGHDWSGRQDNWRGLGGQFPNGAPVTVTSRYPGNLDLFVTDSNGRVRTSWWYEGHEWSSIAQGGWVNLGGVFPDGARLAAYGRITGGKPISGDPMTLKFDIHTDDAVPVGGWSQVVLRPNGSFTFSGHLHDSGFPSYDTAVAWAVGTSDGIVFTFDHEGEVEGTSEFGGPDRDDDYVVNGSHPGIRDHWATLRGGTYRCEAKMDMNVGDLVANILSAIVIVIGRVAQVYSAGQSRKR